MARNSSEKKEVYVIEANALTIYKTQATVTNTARGVIKTAQGVSVIKPMWSVHESTVRRHAIRIANKRITLHEKEILKLKARKRIMTSESYKIKN